MQKDLIHLSQQQNAIQPVLKTEIDKIDVHKLKAVLLDLSKRNNVVKNEVAKKSLYDKLVAIVNNIDKDKIRRRQIRLKKNQ